MLSVVWLLSFGADINLATDGNITPLMIAALKMQPKIVRYLLKQGADAQKVHPEYGTAADAYILYDAPPEETAYFLARMHCANPSCANAGLKKCERCLEVYFCGSACIRAHWLAHKAECTVAAAKIAIGIKSSSSSSSFTSS
jgi:hypothetical protein